MDCLICSHELKCCPCHNSELETKNAFGQFCDLLIPNSSIDFKSSKSNPIKLFCRNCLLELSEINEIISTLNLLQIKIQNFKSNLKVKIFSSYQKNLNRNFRPQQSKSSEPFHLTQEIRSKICNELSFLHCDNEVKKADSSSPTKTIKIESSESMRSDDEPQFVPSTVCSPIKLPVDDEKCGDSLSSIDDLKSEAMRSQVEIKLKRIESSHPERERSLEVDVPKNRPKNLSPKSKSKLQCLMCERTFMFKPSLTVHMQQHKTNEKTPEKPKSDKSSHRSRASNSKEFSKKCDYCHLQFDNIENYKEHSKSHKRYKCEMCQKDVLTLKYLYEHMRIHTGERPYGCTICKKTFRSHDNLTSHMEDHPNCTKCKICGKFVESSHLASHHETHSKEKIYNCLFCNMSFTDNDSLKIHLKDHGGEREELSANQKFLVGLELTNIGPSNCEICGKSLRKSDYKMHLNTHRDFQCSICNKRFIRKVNLTEHLEIHKNEPNELPNSSKVSNSTQNGKKVNGDKEKKYPCKMSGKVNHSSILTNHMLSHEKTFDCKVCDKSFSRRGELKAHKKSHDDEEDQHYLCTICNLKFLKLEALKEHNGLTHGNDNGSKMILILKSDETDDEEDDDDDDDDD